MNSALLHFLSMPRYSIKLANRSIKHTKRRPIRENTILELIVNERIVMPTSGSKASTQNFIMTSGAKRDVLVLRPVRYAMVITMYIEVMTRTSSIIKILDL